MAARQFFCNRCRRWRQTVAVGEETMREARNRHDRECQLDPLVSPDMQEFETWLSDTYDWSIHGTPRPKGL